MTIGGKGVIMRETLIVILSGCEGSAPMAGKTIRRHSERSEESTAVMGKPVRRHQNNRFFTLCHIAASRLSHKAFLSPLRMTIGGKGVIMRETLIVILSGCEGSAPMVGKTIRHHSEHSEGSIAVMGKPVRRHRSNRFFTPCHYPVFLSFSPPFLPSFRMTILGKHVTNNGERKAS